MFTKQQYRLADNLLEFLLENKGRIDTDDYLFFMTGNEKELQEAMFVRDTLRDELQLIAQFGNTVHHIRLTRKGEKAADSGLKLYLEGIDKEQGDAKRLPSAQLSQISFFKISSIAAIVLSLINFIYLIYFNNNTNHIEKSDTKAYIQSHIRHYSDSVNSAIQLRDSLLIQKFKQSIKHDTTFLKELAKAIDGLKNTP